MPIKSTDSTNGFHGIYDKLRKHYYTIDSGQTAEFDLNSISGLQYWHKVRGETSYSDDGTIGSLTDFATSGIGDATQSTEASKPVYKTSIVNGHPVARFDGNDDYMDLGGAVSATGTFTFAVVLGTGSGETNNIWVGTDSDTSFGAGIGIVTGVTRFQIDDETNVTHSGSDIPTSGFQYRIFRRDGSNNVTERVNGSLELNTTKSGTANLGTLGARKGDSVPVYLDADIAEVAYWNTYVDGDDLTNLENHFATIYNIT